MGAEVRETLNKLLKAFASEITWGEAMHARLKADDFELTHARKLTGNTWLLRAKPPHHLQEGFGLAPEILFVAVRGQTQARDLQSAAAEVARSGFRLDRNLVVVTDDAPAPLQERLDRMPVSRNGVAWVWNDKGQWPSLSQVFRRALPTFDVFAEYDPVRGDQLMGRDTELGNLRTRVMRGDAIGVFGLRKMGKTSLVRAVTDELDTASALVGMSQPGRKATEEAIQLDSDACVVWVDAEGLDQDASVEDVADEMLNALRRRMQAAAVPYTPPRKSGMAGLKAAGEALLDDGKRLCFVVDEYDFLFEREGGRGQIPGISRLLRLVRAWAQQWQGAVSLVLIGRDPEHLSVPQLDGITNPLLAWFTPLWLGPLAPPYDGEMLRRLGRRVGLDVGSESKKLARRWSGGHPLLHRQFGSALREEIQARVPSPFWKVPTDPYCQGAVQRFLNRDPVQAVDREIMHLLKKRYDAAYNLLLALAGSATPEAIIEEFGGLGAAGAKVLQNFGLLDQTTLEIPKHLSWYVQTLHPPRLRAAG